MGKIVFKAGLGATAIDNIFIDEYMCKASLPVFSLIYIYGVRCAMAGLEVSNEEIADKFHIFESEVIKAWEFWEKEGLVALSGSKENMEISFLQPEAVPVEVAATKEVNKTEIVPAPVKRIEPVYNPSDISKLMSENPRVKNMVLNAQNLLGKTFNSNESALIVKMYDWLGMSETLITMLLGYCTSKDKKSMAYIEKVAMDWHEKGISTCEQAEEYLNVVNNDYKEILGFCGVRDKTPTKSQQDYMYKWIYDYKMPLPVIEQACNRTVDTTGKATFKYINSIIESWHKKGVKAVKDIEIVDAEFVKKLQEKKATKKLSPKPATGYGNKFINYNQPDYSQEQWEEIMARKAKANEL